MMFALSDMVPHIWINCRCTVTDVDNSKISIWGCAGLAELIIGETRGHAHSLNIKHYDALGVSEHGIVYPKEKLPKL